MRRCRVCKEPFVPTSKQRQRSDWICASCETVRNMRREDERKEQRSYKENLYSMSRKEIAEELGIKESTVQMLLRRAYSKIRRYYADTQTDNRRQNA